MGYPLHTSPIEKTRRLLTASVLAPVLACASLLHAAPTDGEEKEKITESQLQEAARQIDALVAKIYKREGVSVPEDASDSVFLRRSFLLAVGRIPTVEEARVFLESDDPNKRVLLVRYLMNSKGYESHMGNWLIDMLRVRDHFENGRTAAPYMAWVRNSVAENQPYDAMTRELLSAQGAMWKNGAVGYYIRDKGMELDNMSNTMRLFLGTRMECAQCHDDPFNDWERMDFFRLAAFTNGQSEMRKGVWDTLWREIRDAKTERTPLGKMVRFLGDEVYYASLTGAGTGRIKLPGDYQYRDGSPGEWVGAHTPFGKSTRMSDRRDDDDGLETFASWVTDPRNERFATIITNRMWKRIIGVGLFEPVDEYQKPENTTSPELTRYLVRLMHELGYDLKAFQHALLLTRVYAFASSDQELAMGEKPLFDGRKIERMSAEQYWDSLVTMIAGNPDKLPTRGSSDSIYYGGRPVLVGEMTMAELQQQVLAIDDPKKLRTFAADLLDRISKGSESGRRKNRMMMRSRDSRGALEGIARASELASPAPKGHVLQIFGQSDRLLLDSATREANATQVLSMLNGQVEKLVVANDGAHIHKLSQGSPQDRIRAIFFGTLSRSPSEAEMQLMLAEVEARGEAGYRNIISALVNTREFIFIP
ncbi:DUF1549 domain-containing protein [Verrucomicrobiaceae bacterium R5-34]|uniref:DUF1549 domain-containing protein n=1 Tax=Oceaniferula flava TaxID=2800421 RepID=A0AAE2VF26_9BACT|nr:DUF1549 domain-containing protein [Oceaniferula flavus]MBK1832303.1 DUF1549 domain-containing protein [Verrucomicrobiaceae bacterium R5-34]MBK1856529.1 DUF1549 domain-containing protein [Oceaniferula flavus]MBM1137836.1 DUF1549 domain-containing protein [Oceaniferula flavus]